MADPALELVGSVGQKSGSGLGWVLAGAAVVGGVLYFMNKKNNQQQVISSAQSQVQEPVNTVSGVYATTNGTLFNDYPRQASGNVVNEPALASSALGQPGTSGGRI